MAKQNSALEQREVAPGLIGMSRGDTTINAIVYGVDGLFYFYPVTVEQANALEDWHLEGVWYDDLEDILPDASKYDLDMILAGEELID
jgi:hypothetical protein